MVSISKEFHGSSLQGVGSRGVAFYLLPFRAPASRKKGNKL